MDKQTPSVTAVGPLFTPRREPAARGVALRTAVASAQFCEGEEQSFFSVPGVPGDVVASEPMLNDGRVSRETKHFNRPVKHL